MSTNSIAVISQLTGISEDSIQTELDMISISNPEPAYSIFFRLKKDGKSKRWIQAPNDFLKELQRQISVNMLDKFPPSRFAHGWIGRRSPLTEAKFHLEGQPIFGLSWDIEKCYPSTGFEMAEKLFQRLVAEFYLDDPTIDYDDLSQKLATISTVCYHRRITPVLPTGAPTSCRIVNQILRRFDAELYAAFYQAIGNEYFRFTRYGDDLTVTSPYPLDQQKLTDIVKGLLKKYGYVMNDQKVRVMQAGNSWPPLEVSGLILDVRNDRLLMSDKRLKQLELDIIDYLHLPGTDEETLTSLKIKIGTAVKIYSQLPGRIRNQLIQTLNDPGFHQNRQAKDRFAELTTSRRYQGQISYELLGATHFANWLPKEVMNYV